MASTNKNQEFILMKRNEELEKELTESMQRVETIKKELQKALERLRVAEEAEETLCYQLGELEAESSERAREYNENVMVLMEQISLAQKYAQQASMDIS